MKLLSLLVALFLASAPAVAGDAAQFAQARENARVFDQVVASTNRVLKVWLTHADPKTLLLPDRVVGRGQGLKPGDTRRLYTPHNSGADLYPYLILTAHLTDPDSTTAG